MTLNEYLENRRRWEIVAVIAILLLFAVINATSLIIENYREGNTLQVGTAFALELTSSFSVAILIPGVIHFLRWLNLSFANFRWRVLWHIPGYIGFCLAHVSLMIFSGNWCGRPLELTTSMARLQSIFFTSHARIS